MSDLVIVERCDGGKGTVVRYGIGAKIVAQFQPGMTVGDLARLTGEKPRFVRDCLKRNGVVPAKGKRGGYRANAGRKPGGRA